MPAANVRGTERRAYPPFAVRGDANAFASSVNVEAQVRMAQHEKHAREVKWGEMKWQEVVL